MDQIFIRVKTIKNGLCNAIDKDIRDCTDGERMNYYLSISKGMVVSLLEQYVKNQIEGVKSGRG